MSFITKKSSATIAVGVAVIAAAGTAWAQSQGSDQPVTPDRNATYLERSNTEVTAMKAGTLTSIQRQFTIDGREVYALTGDKLRCILIAKAGSEDGKSEQLGCAPAQSPTPLAVQYSTTDGKGQVDAVWTGRAASASAEGAGSTTTLGATVTAVTRTDAYTAARLDWKASDGHSSSYALQSRAVIEQQIRKAAAARGLPAPSVINHR